MTLEEEIKSMLESEYGRHFASETVVLRILEIVEREKRKVEQKKVVSGVRRT